MFTYHFHRTLRLICPRNINLILTNYEHETHVPECWLSRSSGIKSHVLLVFSCEMQRDQISAGTFSHSRSTNFYFQSTVGYDINSGFHSSFLTPVIYLSFAMLCCNLHRLRGSSNRNQDKSHVTPWVARAYFCGSFLDQSTPCGVGLGRCGTATWKSWKFESMTTLRRSEGSITDFPRPCITFEEPYLG